MNLMCPPWYWDMLQQKAARAKRSASSKSNGSLKHNNSSSGKQPDAKMGFDHEEMGMTAERQRVIQASLFKMLGQADNPAAPTEPKHDTNTAPPGVNTKTDESS